MRQIEEFADIGLKTEGVKKGKYSMDIRIVPNLI